MAFNALVDRVKCVTVDAQDTSKISELKFYGRVEDSGTP